MTDLFRTTLQDIQVKLNSIQLDIQDVLAAPPDGGEYNATPATNLQQLIDSGVKTINMEPGVYNQDLVLNFKTGITINGNGSTLTGASVYHNWTQEGEIYTIPWRSSFKDECPLVNDGKNFACDPYGFLSEIGVRRELVSINNILYTQVLSLSELEPGSYFVGDDKIYIYPAGEWASPSIASLDTGVSINECGDIAINNLTIREFATKPDKQTAALSISKSKGITLDSVKILSNNWSGLSLDQSESITIRGLESDQNGFEGIVGHWNWDVHFEDCKITRNNWRAYRGGMHNWAIGQKFLKNHRLTFLRCLFEENFTKGLWIDFANEDVLISNCTIRDNMGIGLALEANGEAVVVQECLISGNEHWGIEVRASTNLIIANNVIKDNAAGFLSRSPEPEGRVVRRYDETTRATIEEYRIYKSRDWTVRDNVFENNGGIAANGRSQTMWFVDQSDMTLFETSLWDNNTYRHSEDRIFGFPGQFWVTLDKWQETGIDQASTYERLAS